MNWSKTKNIIIAVLLVTDILLCYMYITNVLDGRDEERMDRFNKYLKSQDVHLKSELPESSGQKPVLFVLCLNGEVDFEKNNQYGKLNEIKNEKDLKKETDRMIKKMGFREDVCRQVKVAHIGGKDYDVFYKSYYLDTPLEKSEMILEIRDGYINRAKVMMLEPIKEGGKSNKIINASTATIGFIEERRNKGIKEKIVIEDIKEVYWLNDEGRQVDEVRPDQDTLVPAWEITYNGGQKKYIEAYVAQK